MVTGRLYGIVLEQVWNSTFSWENNNIRVALVKSTHTLDQHNDDFWSDVLADETAGTAYTAKGELLASKTATASGYDNAGTFALDAADKTWGTSTITAQIAVVYYDSGTNSTSSLICYQDNGSNVSTTAGTFTVAWNASGIVQITVA